MKELRYQFTFSEVAEQENAISKSLKRLKENVQVGIKFPLSFKKLKEEHENNQNSFAPVVTSGGTVTTSNPSYMSKPLNNDTQSFSDSLDGSSNPANGSKNNLYLGHHDSSSSFNQSEHFSTPEVLVRRPGLPGTHIQKDEVPASTTKPVNHFEYGSRDYLDQLENSPTEQQNMQPIQEQKWIHKFSDSESEDVKGDSEQERVKKSKQVKQTPKSENARKTVEDALEKGFFTYDDKKEDQPTVNGRH